MQKWKEELVQVRRWLFYLSSRVVVNAGAKEASVRVSVSNPHAGSTSKTHDHMKSAILKGAQSQHPCESHWDFLPFHIFKGVVVLLLRRHKYVHCIGLICVVS
jgi:hypothetical protein